METGNTPSLFHNQAEVTHQAPRSGLTCAAGKRGGVRWYSSNAQTGRPGALGMMPDIASSSDPPDGEKNSAPCYGRAHSQESHAAFMNANRQEQAMNITESMVSAHHLAAAERWIVANGMPTTDSELSRMGREVAQEAYSVVEHMACKAFEALDAHSEDRKVGVETLAGMKGRELLSDIYHEMRARA